MTPRYVPLTTGHTRPTRAQLAAYLLPAVRAVYPFRMYGSPKAAWRAGRRHALAGRAPAEGSIAWPGHYEDGWRSVDVVLTCPHGPCGNPPMFPEEIACHNEWHQTLERPARDRSSRRTA